MPDAAPNPYQSPLTDGGVDSDKLGDFRAVQITVFAVVGTARRFYRTHLAASSVVGALFVVPALVGIGVADTILAEIAWRLRFNDELRFVAIALGFVAAWSTTFVALAYVVPALLGLALRLVRTGHLSAAPLLEAWRFAPRFLVANTVFTLGVGWALILNNWTLFAGVPTWVMLASAAVAWLWAVPATIIAATSGLYPFLILEDDMGAVESLAASAHLTRGQRIRIVGIAIVCTAIGFALFVIPLTCITTLVVALLLFPPGYGSAFILATLIGLPILSAATGWIAIAITVLYVRLRGLPIAGQ